MTTRFFLILIGTMLLPTAIIGILITYSKESLNASSGFHRNILPPPVLITETPKDAPEISKVCGEVNDKIFFRGKEPSIIYGYKLDNQTWDTTYLIVPNSKRVSTAYDLVIDSLGGTLYSGNLGSYYYCPFNAKDSNEIIMKKFDSPLFMQAVPISKGSIILRSVDSSGRNIEFVKANKDDGAILSVAPFFKKPVSEAFAIDGTLTYDQKSGRLNYIQYYNNELICFDSSMNIVYNGKTIGNPPKDSIFTKTIRSGSLGSIQSGIPLNKLNVRARAHNGLLYIQSNVKTANEDSHTFKESVSLDIYRISDGRYTASLKLPQEGNRKITDFYIIKNRVIAIYSGHLKIFQCEIPNS